MRLGLDFPANVQIFQPNPLKVDLTHYIGNVFPAEQKITLETKHEIGGIKLICATVICATAIFGICHLATHFLPRPPRD